MSQPKPSPSINRQRIEDRLLEEVQQAQKAWCEASDGEREWARQQFIEVLDSFNSVVLYGKEPVEGRRATDTHAP
jgi:hypothetical protein